MAFPPRPPRLSPAERDDGGQGTTFRIYLPASSKKGLIEEKELPDKILKGKETILLVDDEDIVIDVGEEILKTLGYKVFSVRSGKEAIELYKENREKIDMVLLDMVMPDMGGGETYDRMKEINPDIKVLLLSGYSIDGKARSTRMRLRWFYPEAIQYEAVISKNQGGFG